MLRPSIFIASATALTISGCSITSFLGEARSSNPMYVISIPPNRVGYGGHMNQEDRELLLNLTRAMLSKPYQDYSYKYPIGVGIKIHSTSDSTTRFSGSTRISKEGI